MILKENSLKMPWMFLIELPTNINIYTRKIIHNRFFMDIY